MTIIRINLLVKCIRPPCLATFCGLHVQLHLIEARAECGVKGPFQPPPQTHSLTLRAGCRLILIPIHLDARISYSE